MGFNVGDKVRFKDSVKHNGVRGQVGVVVKAPEYATIYLGPDYEVELDEFVVECEACHLKAFREPEDRKEDEHGKKPKKELKEESKKEDLGLRKEKTDV